MVSMSFGLFYKTAPLGRQVGRTNRRTPSPDSKIMISCIRPSSHGLMQTLPPVTKTPAVECDTNSQGSPFLYTQKSPMITINTHNALSAIDSKALLMFGSMFGSITAPCLGWRIKTLSFAAEAGRTCNQIDGN